MAEQTGGGPAAPVTQQRRQEKTDTALEQERDTGATDDRYGGDEPLPYPEHEPLSEVTYRDPRPLDWPQKADRSVYVSPVLKLDPDPDADDPDGYVHTNDLDTDEDGVSEISLGGDAVEHAQVIAGGGQLILILNGTAFNLGALGGGVNGELQRALQMNANS